MAQKSFQKSIKEYSRYLLIDVDSGLNLPPIPEITLPLFRSFPEYQKQLIFILFPLNLNNISSETIL
jgi:hypothetical protein